MLDQVMPEPESSHTGVLTSDIPPAQGIDSKSREPKSAPASQLEPPDDSEILLDHIISDSDSNAEQANISTLLAHRRRQRLKVESEYGPEVKQIISDKRNWGGWHTTTNDPVGFPLSREQTDQYRLPPGHPVSLCLYLSSLYLNTSSARQGVGELESKKYILWTKLKWSAAGMHDPVT